jgi:hypothetical protein
MKLFIAGLEGLITTSLGSHWIWVGSDNVGYHGQLW